MNNRPVFHNIDRARRAQGQKRLSRLGRADRQTGRRCIFPSGDHRYTWIEAHFRSGFCVERADNFTRRDDLWIQPARQTKGGDQFFRPASLSQIKGKKNAGIRLVFYRLPREPEVDVARARQAGLGGGDRLRLMFLQPEKNGISIIRRGLLAVLLLEFAPDSTAADARSAALSACPSR